MAVFSSTQNTAACCGGLTYRAMTSAALASKAGSSDAIVTFDAMRFKPGARPHPGHHHVANTQFCGQLAAAPVGRPVAWSAPGPFQNLCFQAGRPFVDHPKDRRKYPT